MNITIKDVREAIAGLPDEAPVFPTWNEPPGDEQPAVQLDAIRRRMSCDGEVGLALVVSLVDLEDIAESEAIIAANNGKCPECGAEIDAAVQAGDVCLGVISNPASGGAPAGSAACEHVFWLPDDHEFEDDEEENDGLVDD